jgi:bifunctional DNA-binding transcriptional regulator/antitoxin component of YhaV-PrlF toxin-antitoxin module
MVKLQKRYAYTYKDKNHYKHIITVPDEVIERLGWKDGQEIEPTAEDGKLILRPQDQKRKRHSQ